MDFKERDYEQAALCIMTEKPEKYKVQSLIKLIEYIIIDEKKDDYTFNDYIKYLKNKVNEKNKKEG